MSKFSKFMKNNKKTRENTFYAATDSLCDGDGNPLQWEIRPITSKELEAIRDDCMIDVPIAGKPNAYRPRLKMSLYLQRMIVASVVEPDLYDAELQDSYGVNTPEDLLLALVDNPGEYNAFAAFIQDFQGGSKSFADKVNEAKN